MGYYGWGVPAPKAPAKAKPVPQPACERTCRRCGEPAGVFGDRKPHWCQKPECQEAEDVYYATLDWDEGL